MINLVNNKKCLSENQEDYLKQIFFLTESAASASTQDLARVLEVAPSSVTVMLQKLSELNLVVYEQYKGARLTPGGRLAALEILRHHRLLESFLQKALGYTWEEVHEEAERLEHYISETFEARMAAYLGHPSHDPHGDPIPDSSLALPDDGDIDLLVRQAPRFQGILARVTSQDKDELHLFTRLGLVPGAVLTLLGHAQDGLRVGTAGGDLLIPTGISQKLWINKKTEEKL